MNSFCARRISCLVINPHYRGFDRSEIQGRFARFNCLCQLIAGGPQIPRLRAAATAYGRSESEWRFRNLRLKSGQNSFRMSENRSMLTLVASFVTLSDQFRLSV